MWWIFIPLGHVAMKPSIKTDTEQSPIAATVKPTACSGRSTSPLALSSD